MFFDIKAATAKCMRYTAWNRCLTAMPQIILGIEIECPGDGDGFTVSLHICVKNGKKPLNLKNLDLFAAFLASGKKAKDTEQKGSE